MWELLFDYFAYRITFSSACQLASTARANESSMDSQSFLCHSEFRSTPFPALPLSLFACLACLICALWQRRMRSFCAKKSSVLCYLRISGFRCSCTFSQLLLPLFPLRYVLYMQQISRYAQNAPTSLSLSAPRSHGPCMGIIN